MGSGQATYNVPKNRFSSCPCRQSSYGTLKHVSLSSPLIYSNVRQQTKELMSSTEGHSDFVKALFVLAPLKLLASGGSDKIVRLWQVITIIQDISSTNFPCRNLANIRENTPLETLCVISAHTRPVEAIDARTLSATSAELCTGDTMGVIKLWTLSKEGDRWRSTLKAEFDHHRTRINELYFNHEFLWTGEDYLFEVHGGSADIVLPSFSG